MEYLWLITDGKCPRVWIADIAVPQYLKYSRLAVGRWGGSITCREVCGRESDEGFDVR
jgi:hypothetical protein